MCAAEGVWYTRRLFLAGVAGCYLFAFASLHAQLPGLIGPTPPRPTPYRPPGLLKHARRELTGGEDAGRDGLLPVTTYIQGMQRQLEARGRSPTARQRFGVDEDDGSGMPTH